MFPQRILAVNTGRQIRMRLCQTDLPGIPKKRKPAKETAFFKAGWRTEFAAGDPYYNRNLSLERTDYSIK